MDYNWHSLLASLECANIIPVWPIAFGPVAPWKAPLFAGTCMSMLDSARIKIHQDEKRKFGSWSWKVEIGDQCGVWMQNRLSEY